MIRIIASNNSQKGKIFEEFVKKMLDGTGYYNFKTVRKTGRQIDIYAKDRVTDQPIICECKAYESDLDGEHLTKFRGIFDLEYDKDNSYIGLFFSLSGFGGGFIELYDEMCEASEDLEKRFKIFSFDHIYNFLKKANIIESIDVIKFTIEKKLPYEITELYLSVSEYGEYWVVIFGIDDVNSHFAVLSAKGEEVQKYVIENLKKLDSQINTLTPINLNVRTKVILNLCDQKIKNIIDISNEIGESKIDVEMALSNLVREEIVPESDDQYKINDELDVFIRLSKEFIPSKHKYEYFKTSYVQNMIDERLIEHIETRFYINLTDDQEKVLIETLKISPVALLNSIKISTESYRKEAQRTEKFPEESKQILNELTVSNFFGIITKSLFADLEEQEHTQLLSDKDIKGYSVQLQLKFASLKKMLININVKNLIIIAKADGKIEKGQLITAANDELTLETALLYQNLGEYESALKEYDEIIDKIDDEMLKASAWNNKGLIFEILNDPKTIECFDNSINIKPTKEAYMNSGRILLRLGQENEDLKYIEASIEKFELSLSIDNEYEKAQRFLEEAKKFRDNLSNS